MPSTLLPGGFTNLELPGTIPKEGFELHWRSDALFPSTRRRSLQADETTASETITIVAVMPADFDGWLGLGFADTYQMIGADAVVGATQGPVEMYDLNERSPAGVVAKDPTPLTLTEARKVDGQPFFLNFTMPVDGYVDLDSQLIIWALGPDGNYPPNLMQHTSQGSFVVSFRGGEVAAPELSELQKQKRAHGLLMTVSWGFLLPAGAVIAKFFKHKAPLWFHCHRAFQVLGLLIALVGWIIALVNFKPLGNSTSDNVNNHGAVGIVVMVLGLLQPLNAVIRPHATKPGEQKTMPRFLWECLHKGSGWLAIALSVWVISLGIENLYDQEKSAFPNAKRDFWVLYGAALAVVLVLAVVGFVMGQMSGDGDQKGVTYNTGTRAADDEKKDSKEVNSI